MSASSPLRLRPVWAEKLRNYVTLQATKKTTAAAAAAADNAVKAARGEILLELGEATAAVCGNMVVSVKTGADAEKTITLATGQKIPWSSVTSLLIGNTTVKGSDVISIYGGRQGSAEVTVA